MSRAVTLGNGNLLVGLDHSGQVRDFYYPYVGHSNHVSGASGSFMHRIGIWVDGDFAWLSRDTWDIEVNYAPYSGASDINAQHNTLDISIHITDVVHNEKDAFIRKLTVRNGADKARTVKVFFGQEFRISESRRGDTAFYDPRIKSIIHYKGHNAFLAYAMHEGKGFDDFSVGLFGIEEKLGTYKDAEDGKLSQNPIEHGSVDSVIGLTIEAGAKDSNVLYYWIAAEKSIHELHTLHKEILKETPERLIESTSRYWQAWIEKESREFRTVDTRIANLYARSLAVMRVHADNRGGIIASSDTDVLNQGRDTYSYVWPRDAAIIANALDRAGHHDVTQRFFLFMKDCMEPGGYLMHKYRIDGVLGSSWHPWMQHGHPRLPIQEDETATVLYMLNQHYAYAKDIEFIETLYNPFIEKVADFLCTYTDADTGLPKESYDLWEERYGSSTYTAASVFGALMAAAELSSVLGKKENAKRYKETAEAVKKAILSYLYDPHLQMFIKLVRAENGDLFYDKTIDLSSFFSIIVFGVLDADEKIVRQAFDAMAPILKVPTSFGGYMRFDGDNYYRADRNVSPNAWCITTLWVARYYIRIAKNRNELLMAHEILKWICDRAAKSGLLPEQIHPLTGAHLSTTPLVWSHAEFVIAVDEYLKKEATL